MAVLCGYYVEFKGHIIRRTLVGHCSNAWSRTNPRCRTARGKNGFELLTLTGLIYLLLDLTSTELSLAFFEWERHYKQLINYRLEFPGVSNYLSYGVACTDVEIDCLTGEHMVRETCIHFYEC